MASSAVAIGLGAVRLFGVGKLIAVLTLSNGVEYSPVAVASGTSGRLPFSCRTRMVLVYIAALAFT